mgnify:CR=1 FL=1
MLIKFCRKLIILASFLFVLGFAQTQVSADDSKNSSSSLISDDTTKALDDASKQAEKAVEEVTNDAEKNQETLPPQAIIQKMLLNRICNITKWIG